MVQEKFKKIGEKIDSKLLLFRVFDDPRPKYIAKVTLIDKFFKNTILWIFPEFVRPNHITIFRFISIPFIIYYLVIENYQAGLILFVISALSDAFDGAIARTRNKITDWGIVFDPVADKILIGSAGGILIFKFINPILAYTVIFLELIIISLAYYRFKGEIVPAKTVGKIKMVLQCFGVSFILLFLVVGNPLLIQIATGIIFLSVIFAILSLTIYRSI
ncbi:MAG: CDP-alcohol phosphatidyltransferase family protein [Candidatus Taylorbacteria bacterium]|nr:CDP-alcohol phosphatidyltransferase family protein [Candidatus Taylorbacteria bacterium]